MSKPPLIDLYSLPEDERIDIMGRLAQEGKIVGFYVENDDKATRYLEKILENYKISVIHRGMGPVEGTVFVKIGPVKH